MASNAAAFRRTLEVFAEKTLSPAARAHVLAEAAINAKDALIASGRASTSYITYVDGRAGAPEETVRNRIIYRFSYLASATAFALSFLQASSPTGRRAADNHLNYKDAFWIGIDGGFMMAASFNPVMISPLVKTIMIGNVQPYNRKVDTQMKGSTPLHYSVAPFLFARAVVAVNGRYGGAVGAARVYRSSFPGQYVVKYGEGRGERVDSPALILTIPD